MFTIEQRDRVRERLLSLAEADPDVTGAAITGSHVADASDEWSDIDLAFGIRGDLSTSLEQWTEILYRDFAAIHHWDLPWGSTVYRVFLLPDLLQVDIAFTPAADFGPRGPNWRTVFGEPVDVAPSAPVPPDELVGLAWVYARHARTCIERRRPWQAEWMISGIRGQVIALACLRLGHPTRYARGADLLPLQVTGRLDATLVRSLDETELSRALAAATEALAAELERTDAALAAKLQPMLAELR